MTTSAWRRWSPSALWVVLASLVSSPVLALLALTPTNRLVADDFSIAVRLRRLGLVGAWRDQMVTLNGRFAGYALADVLTAIGGAGPFVATLLAFAGLGLAAHLALPDRDRPEVRVFSAVAVVAALVLSSPALVQSYLWISGVGMATAALALAVVASGLAWRAAVLPERRLLPFVVPAGLVVLSTGAYECVALVVGSFVGAGLLATGWRRRGRAWPAYACLLGGAVVGLAIVAIIPGSSTRRREFPAARPLRPAIDAGIHEAAPFVWDALRSKWTLLAFLAGLVLTAPGIRWRTRLRWVTCISIGGYAAVVATLAFAYFAIGGTPPGRTLAIPLAALTIGAAAAGWVIPVPRGSRPALAAFAVVVALAGALPIVERLPDRRRWAAAWDRRDAFLRSADERGVLEVAPIADAGSGLDDVGADRTFWVNEAVARYYGHEAVFTAPPAGDA